MSIEECVKFGKVELMPCQDAQQLMPRAQLKAYMN